MTETTTMTPIAERVALLDDLMIDKGGHEDFEAGHCSMELVSWLAGQGFTDAPSCASPVIRGYVIALNDRWPDQRRQSLRPFLVPMIGTGGDGLDRLRERIAREYAARHLVGPWLRLAGLDRAADDLEAAPSEGTGSALWLARQQAGAVWIKNREALREKILSLAPGAYYPHACSAVAVAAEADVADVAVVAAAVDGAHYVHAQSAVVDAAVAAYYAHAAADDVAAAVMIGKDYSEAFVAVRAYFRSNPPPAMAQIVDLAARQRAQALELLGYLIAPSTYPGAPT